MMTRPIALILAAIAGVTASCGSTEPVTEREERPRTKAVELYSWQNDAGDWAFALLDGTNRLKSEDEVRSAPDRYVGVDALADGFARLAVGESVFWSHHLRGFTYPAAEMRARIVAAGDAVGVEVWDGAPDEPESAAEDD